jgi:hypothetical protein
MQGKYIISSERHLISEEDEFLWLWMEYLTANSESEIAAQEPKC